MADAVTEELLVTILLLDHRNELLGVVLATACQSMFAGVGVLQHVGRLEPSGRIHRPEVATNEAQPTEESPDGPHHGLTPLLWPCAVAAVSCTEPLCSARSPIVDRLGYVGDRC